MNNKSSWDSCSSLNVTPFNNSAVAVSKPLPSQQGGLPPGAWVGRVPGLQHAVHSLQAVTLHENVLCLEGLSYQLA